MRLHVLQKKPCLSDFTAMNESGPQLIRHERLVHTVRSLSPATKLGQGYIFTGVCHSVNGGVSAPGGVWQTPPKQKPPRPDIPQEHNTPRPDTPPRPDTTPPQNRACCKIRSMRGRYASYWNAILFVNVTAFF